MQKPARLMVTDRFGIVKNVPLEKPVFSIGRHSENDLQVLASSVSRRHVEIIYEQEGYILTDKGSKAGTFVNEERIQSRTLKHLDRIRVGGEGETDIQFIENDKPVPAAPVRVVSKQQTTSARSDLKDLARFVDVNQAFQFALTPDEMLKLVVDSAIEMTRAERGFLMLKKQNGELEFAVMRDHARNSLKGSDFAVSQTVVQETMRKNHTVIVTDRVDDSPYLGTESVMDLKLQTIACIPLNRFQMNEKMDATGIHVREVMGILYLDSRQSTGSLSKTSVTLLESLAFEASKALENVRLMREVAEKQQLESEMALAQEVQGALLPTTISSTGSYEIAAQSIPCRYVGGDFFDLIQRKEGPSLLVLGDVSGKGIAAALLASMAQGVIHTQFSSEIPLPSIMASLNQLIVKKSSGHRFITIFCGILNPDGNFLFVNAGHNPPILVRSDGQTTLLSTGSLVVGAFDFAEYVSREIKLEAGDVIVAFTDGVTEAANGQKEPFGDERLEQLVAASVKMSAEQIKDRILGEVLAFTRGLPQGDDITIMTVKMKPRE